MASLKAAKIRPARSREQFADPTKPAQHSANQLQPLFAARVEPDMKKRIEDWIRASGLTKRQATEWAFELAFEYAAAHGIPAPK